MAIVTATLDANDETCGPLKLQDGERGDVEINVTGTITVTLQRKLNGGSSFFTVKLPDGTTDAAFTADSSFVIEGAGQYQLIASGVSGGSAVCRLQSNMRVHGV